MPDGADFLDLPREFRHGRIRWPTGASRSCSQRRKPPSTCGSSRTPSKTCARHGNGPIFMKLGGRVFYHRADLKTWCKEARRRSSSGREAVKVQPLLGMTIAVALIVAPTVAQQPPLLVIWNASPSVPVGLYLVTRRRRASATWSLLRLPPVIAAFAARRGYLPTSAYLLKPIVAVAGDRVCRLGDARLRAWHARWHCGGMPMSMGSAMPSWQGCRDSPNGRGLRPGRSPRKLRQPLLRSARRERRSWDAPFSSGLTALRADAQCTLPSVARSPPRLTPSYLSEQDKPLPAVTPKSERAACVCLTSSTFDVSAAKATVAFARDRSWACPSLGPTPSVGSGSITRPKTAA